MGLFMPGCTRTITCLYYDDAGRLAGKHFRTNTSCPATVSPYDIRYTYDGGHSSNRSRGQLTQIYYHKRDGYYKNLFYNA